MFGSALRLVVAGCVVLFIAAIYLQSQTALVASVVLALAVTVLNGMGLRYPRRAWFAAVDRTMRLVGPANARTSPSAFRSLRCDSQGTATSY